MFLTVNIYKHAWTMWHNFEVCRFSFVIKWRDDNDETHRKKNTHTTLDNKQHGDTFSHQKSNTSNGTLWNCATYCVLQLLHICRYIDFNNFTRCLVNHIYRKRRWHTQSSVLPIINSPFDRYTLSIAFIISMQ